MTVENRNRILIVDDERNISAFIVEVAVQCGYDAFATDDAEEFRIRVRSWQPSHIVLDLSMPAVDGIELLRFLAIENCKAQVVIASGFDSKVIDSARQLAEERGLSIGGTLKKPIRLEDLTNLLEKIKTDDDWLDEGSILHAIEKGELSLAFQPKITLFGNSGGALRRELAGFEALVRWKHPKHGMVPPMHFIPFAEAVGLMDQLTDAIFRMALAQIQRWDAAGNPYSVSINVSAENLYDINFVDVLDRLCKDAGVSPSQIVIELTETAAMRDVTQAMDILTRMRIKGFKLSMDDFGTGYSSLVQLQRLPFSELKIDQAFVKQCHLSEQSRVIVKTMIDMAHNLSLVAVAEGVETEEATRILGALKCDIVQGYHIGRPMPAEQVEGWLNESAMPRPQSKG